MKLIELLPTSLEIKNDVEYLFSYLDVNGKKHKVKLLSSEVLVYELRDNVYANPQLEIGYIPTDFINKPKGEVNET